MYKALFFDIDDTLLNFTLCSQSALSKAFRHFDLPYDESTYQLFHKIDSPLWAKQKQRLLSVQDVMRIRFITLFDRLSITIDCKKFQSRFQENLALEYILEPGAFEVIRDLSNRFKLYAASNAILTMQQSRLKLANLSSFFTDLYVSEEIGYDKPDRRFFEECLRRSGLESSEVLFIGDSLEADIQGAYNCHIPTCWYNSRKREDVSGIKIDYTIESLLQLKELDL